MITPKQVESPYCLHTILSLYSLVLSVDIVVPLKLQVLTPSLSFQ